MIVLAIDTALTACSAAILETGTDGGRAIERTVAMSRGHAEALMPMLQELLDASGLTLGDINRFGVTIGPGTFTGVRVGVASARGFALATGKPAIGVTTLAAMAETARMAGAAQAVLVAMDARRGEIYAQSFDPSGSAMGPAMVAPAAEIVSALPVAVSSVVGTAAGEILEHAARSGCRLARLAGDAWPRPAAVARLTSAATPADPPAPLYLRPADARPQTGAAIPRR